jgi:hypothetical protein
MNMGCIARLGYQILSLVSCSKWNNLASFGGLLQMKKQLVLLAMLAVWTCSSQAQDFYLGLGLPGLYTLGYAHPMGSSWGLRGEYAGGLSKETSGTDNGVTYIGSFKFSRAGAYADWFPFSGGFRFVGGLTANDVYIDIGAVGTGNATINGKTVSMVGNYFNMRLKYPTATPYLGVGYGHKALDSKGLGFYADVGMTYGSFTADVSTNLVGQNGITQADVDSQKQSMNDSLGSYKWLPSVSLGLVYRY